ncbi:phage late control D family protein [Polyangium mundeleinium]|uniref:Contractile injection system protein, VgrG/Pvc8 family n=1 Tax=Polyangium mundeleinium TaxID=2995306 RepID=A0ABT5ESM7_9BACT|nr:contractile injection system protein, VgrG/Pvc8 family [Polyangium mundeleinium]MDC0744830.1 contractile injection system protein, VgrG/Pvc8 family [Polyangium mundeleinium]
MANALQILTDGVEAGDDSLCKSFGSIEIEESVDLPGAIEISLPLDGTPAGELTRLTDPSIQPYANLSLVATAEEKPPECIFDGYVLSHKIHLETGTTSSTLKVWGQDASWLMNLDERAREWIGMTDGGVANEVFKEYGITPASENTEDDSPAHTESGHTLMQRATDIQFLKQLARRNGKLCRVACADRPGARIGYFGKPNLAAAPAVTLTLNPSATATVHALDFEWDVARPSEVAAQQALFSDPDPSAARVETKDSGLPLLEARGLSDFISPGLGSIQAMGGRKPKALLTTTVDDAGELALRARSLLREAGFFVRCKGEADVSQLKAVLRAGMVVQIDGAGSIHSGKYFVWSVRHTIQPRSHKMSFVLVRNAVGSPPPGGA